MLSEDVILNIVGESIKTHPQKDLLEDLVHFGKHLAVEIESKYTTKLIGLNDCFHLNFVDYYIFDGEPHTEFLIPYCSFEHLENEDLFRIFVKNWLDGMYQEFKTDTLYKKINLSYYVDEDVLEDLANAKRFKVEFNDDNTFKQITDVEYFRDEK